MRIPLATNIQTRDGVLDKDAKLINCFVDSDGGTSFVVKRPGLLKTVATDSGPGLGMVSWEGKMYSATGSSIYQTDYAGIPSGATAQAEWRIEDYGQLAFASGGYNAIGGFVGNGTYLFMAAYNYQTNKTSFLRTSDGNNWQIMSQVVNTASFGFGVLLYCNGVIYLFPYGSGYIFRSSDGCASWIQVGYLPANGDEAYASDGSQIFRKSYYTLFSSVDGSNWTIHGSTPYILTTASFRNMICHKGKVYCLLLVESIGSLALQIAESSDFTNWTYHQLSSNFSGYNPLLAADSENLFVLSSNGLGGSAARFDVRIIDTSAFTISGVLASKGGIAPYALGQIDAPFASANGALVARASTAAGGRISLQKIYYYAPLGYVNPDHAYPYTTVTPGLPLSWVGTSPGTSVKRLFIKNTEKAWTLTLGTPGTLTQVTDVDYPAITVPGAVYLDGYFFVMDKDGTIYNCDLENPTSWNSLDYITAEAEWDKGVAIAKHQNYVVALKDWTTELFYDAANATGSPLSKVSNATIQLGCAQGYSAVQFNGGLVFMSKTREKGRSVHFFAPDSIAPTEIASPAVQRVLNKADLTTVTAWGGKLAGRVLYVLNLVTADITLVYDFSTQTWAQWTSDTTGVEGHFKCGFYATDGSRDYLLHESTGDIFSLTPDAYQDNGANIDVLIRTGRIDGGNMDRKTMHALTVVGDQATTNVTVQYSDDDYQTFSSARTVSMNDSPARLTRLGMFRRRSFDIRHVDNTPLRLMAIDAEMKQAR